MQQVFYYIHDSNDFNSKYFHITVNSSSLTITR